MENKDQIWAVFEKNVEIKELKLDLETYNSVLKDWFVLI
jgi:hypothetical protein